MLHSLYKGKSGKAQKRKMEEGKRGKSNGEYSLRGRID